MNKATILLVDDEQRVLDSIGLLLRRHYTVLTATSGALGLELIATAGEVSVVVSDMRMPGMNGAEFLARVRLVSPATVRMLLTGQSDMASAIAAINQGEIFRFLTKPTTPQVMGAAIEAAISQHRLILAERVLLEDTLRGSVRTLIDVLALANPVLFGRANRVKGIVNALMRQLSMPDQWQIDVAAMMLPLAYVSLPAETVEKLCRAGDLTEEERVMVARLPEITDNLLAQIPRLETVRVILAKAQEPYRQSQCVEPASEVQVVLSGAKLLRVAASFDALMQGGLSGASAVAAMREQPARFDPDVVAALGELYAAGKEADRVLEVSMRGLTAGMVLAEDLITRGGVLLVPRGGEVTDTFVERIRNYRDGTLKETVRVVVESRGP